MKEQDKEKLREEYKSYSDKYFLEGIFLRGMFSEDQYETKEAFSLVKEELDRRFDGFKKFLSEEYRKSGEIKQVFEGVRKRDLDKTIIGNLYFTSEFIFYIPTKVKDPGIGAGGFYVGGPLGYFLAEIVSDALAKKVKTSEELPPLSLLAGLIEGALCLKKDEINKVVFVGIAGGVKKFSFETKDIEKRTNFEIDGMGPAEEFKKAIKEEGIPFEETKGIGDKVEYLFIK